MEQNYLFPNEIESAMDPRTQRTKMSLRKALCDILEKKKLEQITVHELTAEANINRSTFYLHYSNVSEVFREIEDSLYSQYQSTIQQYQELIKNKYYGSDVLQYASMKLLSEGLTLLQKYPTFSPILIEEGLGNRLLRKILSSVEINVSRLNLESSQNPRKRYAQYYIQYVVNGIIATIKEWVAQGMKDTPEEMTRLLGGFISWSSTEKYINQEWSQ